MKHQQFKTLSRRKQFRDLLTNGVCIADRIVEESPVLLFQLYDFYVEVFFNLDGTEILLSRSFESTDELEPYLQPINLEGVL
jgi:hypothetical protein